MRDGSRPKSRVLGRPGVQPYCTAVSVIYGFTAVAATIARVKLRLDKCTSACI